MELYHACIMQVGPATIYWGAQYGNSIEAVSPAGQGLLRTSLRLHMNAVVWLYASCDVAMDIGSVNCVSVTRIALLLERVLQAPVFQGFDPLIINRTIN